MLPVGVTAMQVVLEVLELEVAAAFHESKAPCIERPKRAGTVLTVNCGDCGGVPSKRDMLPKSIKVLRTGISSFLGGHTVESSS